MAQDYKAAASQFWGAAPRDLARSVRGGRDELDGGCKMNVSGRRYVSGVGDYMKTKLILLGGLGVAGFLTGCNTIPPGAERGPDGTMAYAVQIEASEPGVPIEANGERIGNAPVTLKIFGDTDGTFHDFGSYYYIVRALPLHTNQFVQTAVFRTGRWFTPEDRIPRRIYFDMNQPPSYAPSEPGYGPPAYYGPPVYYGPRIYFGPPVYWHGWHRW